MYTVDLHQKNETVQTAAYNLNESIKLARKSRDHVICFIVGYGSTGGTHKIKSRVLELLEELKNKNQIKDYIAGNEMYIFNSKYLNLKGREVLDREKIHSSNPGQIFVIL